MAGSSNSSNSVGNATEADDDDDDGEEDGADNDAVSTSTEDPKKQQQREERKRNKNNKKGGKKKRKNQVFTNLTREKEVFLNKIFGIFQGSRGGKKSQQQRERARAEKRRWQKMMGAYPVVSPGQIFLIFLLMGKQFNWE